MAKLPKPKCFKIPSLPRFLKGIPTKENPHPESVAGDLRIVTDGTQLGTAVYAPNGDRITNIKRVEFPPFETDSWPEVTITFILKL